MNNLSQSFVCILFILSKKTYFLITFQLAIKNGSTIHLVATPAQSNPPQSQPSPQPIPQPIPQPQAGNSNVMMFVVPEGGGTDLNQILNGVLNSIGLNPQNIAGVQATTNVRIVQNASPAPSPIPNVNNNANNANNQNLDNLPEDMKRILLSDKEIQSKKENIHQRPFSNAYLQSFPPAKKVKVASVSELKNLNLVLQSRLREAFKSSSVLDQQPDEIIKDLTQDEQLLKLFKDQLIKDLKQRVQSDPDYEENKFPNIAKLSEF